MECKSFLDNLREAFAGIVAQCRFLIETLAVERFEGSADGIVVLAPEYHFQKLTPENASLQLELKRSYEAFYGLMIVAFRTAPDKLKWEMESADRDMRKWIELRDNWSLTPDRVRNVELLGQDAARIKEILDILGACRSDDIIVVPDTNAIAEHPDPRDYRDVVGYDTFQYILLPTVLGELDSLKVNYRNEAIRDRAKAAIRMIRGWSRQGSLHQGVIVDKTLRVKARHQEPNMNETLSWLDPAVKDDRIIASVLELQTLNPSAILILVTGDINLQNKARACAICVTAFDN